MEVAIMTVDGEPKAFSREDAGLIILAQILDDDYEAVTETKEVHDRIMHVLKLIGVWRPEATEQQIRYLLELGGVDLTDYETFALASDIASWYHIEGALTITDQFSESLLVSPEDSPRLQACLDDTRNPEWIQSIKDERKWFLSHVEPEIFGEFQFEIEDPIADFSWD